jgi:hypothetical protein
MRRDEQPENHALRHQLEGGLEVLEAAAARYRELSATLLARGWKRRLRRSPTLVSDTLAQEPSLPEVLTRLQQRAEREPERSGPASRFLREFEEERTKLWRAMGRRLSLNEETMSLGGGTLPERLTQLRDRVLEPKPLSTALHPLLPGAGETVRLEGTGLWQPLVAAMGFLSPWLVLALIGLGLADNPPPQGWGIVAGLSAATWALLHVRSGRYWLTAERLVWKPRWGQPVELPLSSIGEGDISVNSWGTVKVNSPGGFALRHVPRASTLAALLSIHRRKEFQAAVAVRDPGRLLAVIQVTSTRHGESPDPEEGADVWTAVLRPGFVACFSGAIDGALLLDALTEPAEPTPPRTSLFGSTPRSRDRIPIPFDLLGEQLQLLPEERMDAMLRKAARAYADTTTWPPPAFLWEARELNYLWSGRTLVLSLGDKAVRADLSWKEVQVVQELIEQWKILKQLPEPLAEAAPEALDAVPTASKLSTSSR